MSRCRNLPGTLLTPLAPLAALFSLSSLAGCAAALQVTQIDAAQERPANVLLFFHVTGSAQSGVPGLQEAAFRVKEDDHVIASGVDRVIVNPDLRAAETTMVLLDLGGRPSAEELDALSASASVLIDRIGASRRIGLYALDGAAEPFALAPFGASQDALKAAAVKIPAYKTRDSSLDLNGGYVAALHTLKQATPPSAGPRIANLVLLVRGPDRASRADLRAVSLEVKKSDIDVRRFAIAYGPETEKAKLDPFADGPVVHAVTADQLRDGATSVADAIDERGRSFYLLSYCTAARGGEHKVTVDVAHERAEKDSDKRHIDRGSLTYAFKADGFGPGCTPNVPDGWRTDATSAPPASASRGRLGLTTTGAKVDGATGGASGTGATGATGKGAIPAKGSLAEAVPGH